MQLAVDPSRVEAVTADIAAYLEGRAPLTGLELYYVLERSTPLREFHTVLRQGPQNRTRSGLQQSYGDHNRLLLLGLDKLVEGDLPWYRERLVHPGAVDDERLQGCFDAVQGLGLTRPACVALWLGAALHDCGMLGGGDGNVDVEDGVVLADDVLDELCPAHVRPLASFAIRNHDYIRNVFLGEVPSGFITDQLGELSVDVRAIAIGALGMIQVAGAASLGEGRLSEFRVAIFERCFDGSALDDGSTRTRLARLLSTGAETVAEPELVASADGGAALEPLLRHVPLHGWHRASHGIADDGAAKVSALSVLAERWDASDADHVVLARGLRIPDGIDEPWSPSTSEVKLLNGTTALVVAA
ncbi:MAG: hypothetical protein QOD92_2624 [Acidimicrobiaceae bacterium]